jgi:hypothetical protein
MRDLPIEKEIRGDASGSYIKRAQKGTCLGKSISGSIREILGSTLKSGGAEEESRKRRNVFSTHQPVQPVRSIGRDGSIGSRETQNGKKAELGRSDNKPLAYNAIECLCSLSTWTIEGFALRNMAGSNSVAESPLKIGLDGPHILFVSVVYAIVYLFTVSIDTKADKNSKWDPNRCKTHTR